jgi:hypothetical protein
VQGECPEHLDLDHAPGSTVGDRSVEEAVEQRKRSGALISADREARKEQVSGFERMVGSVVHVDATVRYPLFRRAAVAIREHELCSLDRNRVEKVDDVGVGTDVDRFVERGSCAIGIAFGATDLRQRCET